MSQETTLPSIEPVRAHLLELQDSICAELEGIDGGKFQREELPGERGGLARPRVLAGGDVIEKAAVHFSHTRGSSLPPAATARKPELTGRGFEAVSVSLIVHPRNPIAPTSHANVRFFLAEKEGEAPVWWFGGGFDLTPFYGFEEDCVHWHQVAKNACDSVDSSLYPRFKKNCDEYFWIRHRNEPRGVGGLFYDDFSELGFERSFALHRAVGEAFTGAYVPILEKRRNEPFGEREREFQLYRRGRYVEFNLVYDRGTLFGLQSGGRIESILASMPPLVAWEYDYRPEPGSREAELTERFLVPRDWV